MADENPIAQVREELDEHETADEKRAREESERAAREAEQREKSGEELRAIDAKLNKLSEDLQTCQTTLSSALEKMADQFQQSTQAALEAARETPQPVEPQNPPPPVEPAPVQPQNPPPSGEEDRPAAKTEAKKPGKKLRFL